MLRKQKEAVVKKLTKDFDSNSFIVITRHSKLDSTDVCSLRDMASEAGVTIRFVKNRLAKIALKGRAYEDALGSSLEGSTAIAFSNDPVSAAKVVSKFSNDNSEKLEIVSALYNEGVVDKSSVEQLAKVPPLEEIRGKIVGLLVAPAGKIARLAITPQQNIVGILQKKPEA